MRDPRFQRHGAFTLIELLVVISIIAILASMLIPAVGTVRAMAQQAACSSNQRQMMLAILAYAGENLGSTPAAEGARLIASGPQGTCRTPHGVLMYYDFMPAEYIVSTHVDTLYCPQWYYTYMRWPNPVSCPSVQGANSYQWYYSVRWFTTHPDVPNDLGKNGGSFKVVSMPPKMPYLAETCSPQTPTLTGYWWNRSDAALIANGQNPNLIPTVRISHRGRAVVSFPAGHVAAHTASQLINEDQVMRVWSAP